MKVTSLTARWVIPGTARNGQGCVLPADGDLREALALR